MNNIQFLDGAIGSELIMKGEILPPHIWSAKINLTNPKLLLNIYKEYVKAGSNYITTNTFRTTPRAYKKIGLTDIDAMQIAKKSMQSAIKIAQKAAGNSVKTLASIAPLEDCYIPENFPGPDIAKKEFSLLVKWFEETEIDGYILETMNNILETKICLEAINSSVHPVWVSFNLLDSSHIQSGEKLEDAINMVSNFNIDCLLLNCNSLNRTYDALKILQKNLSNGESILI